MTVGRSHVFTLDGAALSGGAAIVAAGSGLPRRVTGAIDYQARVLALNPNGYWPCDEASGNFLDRTAGAQHLIPITTMGRQQTGHGRGGSTGVGAYSNYSGANWGAKVAAPYAGHKLIAGTPYALMIWTRRWPYAFTNNPSLNFIGHDKLSIAPGGNESVALLVTLVGTSTFTGFVRRFDPCPSALDSLPHCIILYYTGGAFTALASWAVIVDGVSHQFHAAPTIAGLLDNTQGLGVAYQTLQNLPIGFQDVAVWSGANTPTVDQLVALSGATPCGTARWTLPVSSSARTLRGWQLPGRLARADLTRLGVRSYCQIGAGARTEFDPGDDLSVVIPAGATCYLDADLTHYHLDDLPWIGDALGGGPTALYDEADPPVPPQYVAALGYNPVALSPVTAGAQSPTVVTPELLHPAVIPL